MPEEVEENLEESPEEGIEEETEEREKEKESEGEMPSSFFTPEAIAIFTIAGLLDICGWLLIILDFLLIGIPFSFLLDTIGLILIGGWMLMRGGRITGTKGAKKIGGKILKRLGLSFLGELIPLFGDVAPCWTLAVYFTLKSK